MYFKFFKPKSWDKRFAECRWLFIQSFPNTTVIGIGGFRLQGWQEKAVTAKDGITHGSENIATNGANIVVKYILPILH